MQMWSMILIIRIVKCCVNIRVSQNVQTGINVGHKFFWLIITIEFGKTKKISTFFIFSIPLKASKFKYIRQYITYSEFRPLSKKACSSDVKHYFISIFELKVMVGIGVIFMSLSNPTCHFRDTADFTLSTYGTLRQR